MEKTLSNFSLEQELQELIIAYANSYLKRHFKEPESNSVHDEWLNLTELVNYDPEKRTKATWYRLVSEGAIPYYKRGKKLALNLFA